MTKEAAQAKLKYNALLGTKLKLLLDLPSYQETIGKWLAEMKADYIVEMSDSPGVRDLVRAQGKLQAMQSLENKISSVLLAGEKCHKILQKDLNIEE